MYELYLPIRFYVEVTDHVCYIFRSMLCEVQGLSLIEQCTGPSE